MSFSVRVTSPPPGAQWWAASWYSPPNQWDTSYLALDKVGAFAVPLGTGYLYVDVYDSNFNNIGPNPYQTRGYITPAAGSLWEYDFSTGSLTEVPSPPPPPPPPPPPGTNGAGRTAKIVAALLVFGLILAATREGQ